MLWMLWLVIIAVGLVLLGLRLLRDGASDGVALVPALRVYRVRGRYRRIPLVVQGCAELQRGGAGFSLGATVEIRL